MLFLVDCNNFFVSCERVFQPWLQGKPVVVLSSNDGCVVARSNEAKPLIPMGEPYFKARAAIKKNNIQVFSSNFRLYGDMSDRVMSILTQFSDSVDQYSIDESFMTFDDLSDPLAYAHDIRTRVLRWTGIPLSIGIAPTKTLAKAAGEIAKRGDGVCSLLTENSREELLNTMAVGEVWNIGRNHSKRLVGKGILTVEQFIQLPDYWLKSHMGVMGLRIAHELRGTPVFGDMATPLSRKSIMSSRSFGEVVTSKVVLKQAVAHHVVQVAEKVRRQKAKVTHLRVYAYTRDRGADYRGKAGEWREFSFPTNNNGSLLRAANECIDSFFDPRARYIKVGVLLSGLVPENFAPTQSLFDESEDKGMDVVMRCIDTLNKRYRSATVLPLAALATSNSWKTKKNLRTPEYTTDWKGIVEAV